MDVIINRRATAVKMISYMRVAAVAQATLMTGLAGFVDAVGYAAMSHLYLSFMSGNSTQLGMAIAGLDGSRIFWAGAVIGTFVVGAFVGSLIYESASRRATLILLGCEFVCLIFAWSLSDTAVAKFGLLSITLAMGTQNAIHQNIAGAAVGKSFVTGALYGLGSALARACVKGGGFAEAGAFAGSWTAFIMGVVIGGLIVATFKLPPAILIGAAIVFVLLMLSIYAERREAVTS